MCGSDHGKIVSKWFKHFQGKTPVWLGQQVVCMAKKPDSIGWENKNYHQIISKCLENIGAVYGEQDT